ncbi:hypothetical protein GEV29_11945 [Aeromicrobium sp. SMF47]|uniref:Uncharacterized protein n=1 Tax=Aeromicrobium yanjiei TaxID=2662028 RepID=A0A5Q2MER9_9ACTN|nr:MULTISPECIES: hypothetical protein [Aeromicrobium]MRJ77251.1 hypothetical protein [Aeromicrobium yanjiei]MRK01619.1 hypothetical protein [Aeromicrobium sp. S22]QGG41614.1 hypothetical protein GEV26_09725 [Aeromicrobium yanjiei]
MNDSNEVEREIEDDHDLLTYNESSARLSEEIANLRSQIEQAGTDGITADGLTVEAAKQRIVDLEEAAQRNSQLAETDKDAAGFLGFTPGQSTTD